MFYTDEEKAESLSQNFSKDHSKILKQHSPVEENIEQQSAVIMQTLPTQVKTLKCTPHVIVKIIKNLPFNKAPGPDKITAVKLIILPTEPVIQICYIIKACLNLSYFSAAWKIARITPMIKCDRTVRAGRKEVTDR